MMMVKKDSSVKIRDLWRQKGAAAVGVLLLLFVFVFTYPIRAEDIKQGVTKGTNIQVRKDKPVNGEVIATLNTGISVKITKSSEGTDGSVWYYIEARKPSVAGYVRSDFIDLNGTASEDIKEDRILTINFDDVKVRSKASLLGDVLCELAHGKNCTFKRAEFDESGGYYWYYVTFDAENGVTSGFVRQDYFSTDDYRDELIDRGFPESYITRLLVIHDLYPEWEFESYNPVSALTWEKAAEAQYGFSKVEGAAESKDDTSSNSVSDVETTMLNSHIKDASYDDLQYGFASGLGIDSLSGLFSDEKQGRSYITWKKATLAQIKYYMDPRNFMVTENGSLNTSFFMFVDGTDSTGTTEKGVSVILSTTSMTGTLPDESSTTYASLVKKLSDDSKVNPYLVAARLRQEHGSSSGDDLINGKYPGYEEYYNFFNIQANGTNPVLNGLKYAKSQGWDTRRKSISGGLKFLSDNYFYRSVPQNTLYKHRFNYSGTAISHQYMESLYAPHYEAKNVYKGYGTDISPASKYRFLIPVYADMPSEPEGKP